MLHIITDTGSMLSPQEAKDLQVELVPLTVSLDDGAPMREGIDINPKDFLAAVEEGKRPKTSQVNPGAFLDKFNEIFNDGDKILVLTMFSKISGTHNSALLARDMFKHPECVEIFDTLSMAWPQVYQSTIARKLRDQGKTLQEIIEALKQLSCKNFSTLLPRDIQFLVNGGRLDKRLFPIAKLANVHPICFLSDDGVTKDSIKLSLHASFMRMIKLCNEAVPAKQAIYQVMHIDAYEDAQALAQAVKKKLGIADEDISIKEASCLAITHAGPKALVLQVSKKFV